MTGRQPKQLLSDHVLIGFTQPLRGGGQVVRRASSAKVTKPVDPARGGAPAQIGAENSDAETSNA